MRRPHDISAEQVAAARLRVKLDAKLGRHTPDHIRVWASSEPTIAQLLVYLRVLYGLHKQGTQIASSEELAAFTGVNPAKLRKDLSYIGSYGTRGVGYGVSEVIGQIQRTLGVDPTVAPHQETLDIFPKAPTDEQTLSVDPKASTHDQPDR